jgi:hypothetical protein
MLFLNRGIEIASICVCVCLMIVMGMADAFADSCDNLDANNAWTSGFAKLNEAYKAEEWDAALKYSNELEEICELSPTLNYVIARIYKNLGNHEKYLFYLQKSTQNTERFSVDKKLLDDMWSEKYVAAHPEADLNVIKAREATIVEQASEIDSLRFQLKSVQLTADDSIIQHEERMVRGMLWTSVAVSGVGIVLTAVGAVLVGLNNDKAVNADKHGYNVKAIYNTGWALTGAGAGVTVLGVAAAGYFGYQYSRNHRDESTADVSFMLSPSWSSFTLTF